MLNQLTEAIAYEAFYRIMLPIAVQQGSMMSKREFVAMFHQVTVQTPTMLKLIALGVPLAGVPANPAADALKRKLEIARN